MTTKKQIHQGAFLKKMCKDSKVSIADIADSCQYSRASLYRWFNQELLPPHVLDSIARYLKIDISGIFPAVDLFRKRMEENNPKQDYDPETEPKDLRKKYTELLERHTKLLAELRDIEQKYYNLEREVHSGTKSGHKAS